ncbi:MAG: DUF3822 family protein [Ginsengibacter sp.]|jgi:hypothetical protein
MKTLFEILPSSPNNEYELSCEIGGEQIAVLITNKAINTQEGIAVYQFESTISEVEELKHFFTNHPILSGDFKSVHIFYSFKESVFVPFNLYNSIANAETLNLLHGDCRDYATFLGADILTHRSTYNVYRVPQLVHEALQTQFKQVTFSHSYSSILQKEPSEKDLLSITFYSKRMVVALSINSKWHLINEFSFESPQDAVYILLNISQQFDKQNISLEINGFIEENSALFMEISKYFSRVNFSSLPEDYIYQKPILKYPAHYFGALYALKPCE